MRIEGAFPAETDETPFRSRRSGKIMISDGQTAFTILMPVYDFNSLVTHGLGALSVKSETIGVRMLVASLVLIGCLVLALLATVAICLGTGLAIPGWATTAAGLLLILLAQTLMLTVLFSFITLAGRLGMQFLPCRDCAFFVGRVYQLGSNHE